jgi:predicted metalloendopeptidase
VEPWVYVEKKFPTEAKERLEDDSKYYFGLQNRISNLDVCRNKIKTIEKLNKITIKIGYQMNGRL